MNVGDWADKVNRGLAVFPVSLDKRPAVDPATGLRIPWTDVQVTLGNVERYAWRGTFPAVKCGAPSGNVEAIDIDNRQGDEAATYLQRFREMLEVECPGLYERLYIERTQSRGYHIIWRCGVVGPNQVLARRWATAEELEANPKRVAVVTIETRGQGGYVVTAPAPGYTVVQGKVNEYPTITVEERDIVISCLRSFDRAPAKRVTSQQVQAGSSSRWRLRPGDDFNIRGREVVISLLLEHKWTHCGGTLWRRPGKTVGHSATLDEIPNIFYVFSTNASPFDPGVAYDYFGVYALLRWNGDFIAAAADLHNRGYGRGLPQIQHTADVAEMVRQTWHAFEVARAELGEPQLYRTPVNNRLAVWRFDAHSGQPELTLLTVNSLRLVVQANSFWYTVKRNEIRTPSTPPVAVLASMMDAVDKPAPLLRRAVGVPVFVRRPDGSVELLQTPGYDEPSGVYYLPTVALPQLPSLASLQADDQARKAFLEQLPAMRSVVLDDVFGDFPFADEGSRAHAVALMLLPYLRELIKGPTPFHLVDAPIQGSGKGLCVQAALQPFVGTPLAATTETNTSDEWRKRLVSLVLSGAEYLWIDNITREMEWSSIAAALTSQQLQERLLGTNEAPRLPVRLVWVGTSNNAAVGEDMVRRIVYIRLNWSERGVENPAHLPPTQFKHPNLLQWIAANRSHIVYACLALCMAGLLRGLPSEAHKNSFEDWSDVVGGVLAGVGVPGFLSNTRVVEASADTADALYDILRLFYDTWGSAEFTSRQAAELLTQTPMLLPVGVKNLPKYVGKMLSSMRDRMLEGFVIKRVRESRRDGHIWRIVEIGHTSAGGDHETASFVGRRR